MINEFLSRVNWVFTSVGRTIANLSPDEIAAWAGIIAAFIAAIGLFYSGWQTKHSVRASELDQLVRTMELLNAQLAEHTKAFTSTDTVAQERTTVSLLNLMELFAASIRRKLVQGEARVFTLDAVTNLMAYLQHYGYTDFVTEPNYPEEYEHLRWVAHKHKKVIQKRLTTHAAKYPKRPPASSVSSPPPSTPATAHQ